MNNEIVVEIYVIGFFQTKMKLFWIAGLTLVAMSHGDDTCQKQGASDTGDKASGHNLQWTKVTIYWGMVSRIRVYEQMLPYI